jgi:hypothetical protein
MKPFILSLFIVSSAMALSGCLSTGMGQTDEASPTDVLASQAPESQGSPASAKPAPSRRQGSPLDRHHMLR